MYTIQYTHKST